MNGKRGGFNALLPTMYAIDKDPSLELQVVLTDMHLSATFGKTATYARKFISVSKTIPFHQTGGSPRERTEALGRGFVGMAKGLSELKPDIVLLIGDRSETFLSGFAALQLKIPVAHIQGGEVSGNIDGIQRHALTKIAHIHFTETEDAKRRVLRLGEEPWRVHCTGAPYIDFLRAKMYTPEREVRKKFGIGLKEPFLLVLQHSVTTEPELSYPHMREVLDAVEATGFKAIVVYPCSDQGYQGIIDAIEERRGNKKFSIHKNVPAEDFIGLESCTTALVGNSSAAIYEAPYLFTPAVNIGKRQEGREREANVIEVPVKKGAIVKAIHQAQYDKAFLARVKKPHGIYGDGQAYKRIVKVLKTIPLGPKLFEKKITF